MLRTRLRSAQIQYLPSYITPSDSPAKRVVHAGDSRRYCRWILNGSEVTLAADGYRHLIL